MALSNYGELKTSVAAWLDREDLAAIVPDFITLAEKEINAKTELLAMQQRLTVSLVSGSRFATLAANVLKPVYLRIPLDTENYEDLHYFDASVLVPTNLPARPQRYTITDDQLELEFQADANYTAEMLAYVGLALSADGDTNWLLTNMPAVYLYGVLLQAAPYLKDDARLTTWGTLYQNALDTAVELDRKRRQADRVTLVSEATPMARRHTFDIRTG